MSATQITRRGLLMGGCAVLLMPRVAIAQTGGVLDVARNGTLIFTGPNTTAAQRAALGRVATGIARTAPTRAAATAAFRSASFRFLAGAAARTPMGLAVLAGAAVGAGAYYMFTGENALDGLLDISTSGVAVELRYDAACNGLPRAAEANQAFGRPVGLYNNSTSATGCIPYQAYSTFIPASNCAVNPPTPAGWTSDYIRGKYDDKQKCLGFDAVYKKALSTSGGAARFPVDADLKTALTAAQKAKVISQAALNAIGVGVWEDYQGWADGGFTGGGGGSFGGGGATGTWGDNVADAIMGNKPVRGGVTGTGTHPTNPTLEEADTMPTPRPDQTLPDYSFPDKPMFPDDPGYNPDATDPGTGTGGDTGGGTDPTNPGTGTSGPDCYPGQVNCPAKIDWGNPPGQETDTVSDVSPMNWFPSPFVEPSISASCTGFEATFPVGGHVNINPCPTLDRAFPIIRPLVVVGCTVEAGRVLLDV